MAFKLRIAFTGLCAFVPNKREKAKVKMCVVLPDATTNVPRVGTDSSSLRRHRGFIQLKVGQIGDIPAHLRGMDADVITYLERHRVTLNCIPASSRRSVPEFYTGNLDTVASLERMIPGFAAPDPAIVQAIPPRTVLAQVLLNVGQLMSSQDVEKLGRWVFPRSVTNPGFEGALTSEVLLEVPDLKGVELTATSFETGDKTTWELKAGDGETVEIVIANLCDENPLRWEVETRPPLVPDEDFRWYYTLLSNSLQSELLDELKGLPFPIPEPSRSVPNGIGRNCVPETTAAVSYNLDSFVSGRDAAPAPEVYPAVSERDSLFVENDFAQDEESLEKSERTTGRFSSLRKGWEYLMQLGQAAPSAFGARSSSSDFQGEVSFRIVDTRGTFTEVELTRMDFTGVGIDTDNNGPTGRISISGQGRGSLVQTGDRRWSLNVRVDAQVLYRAIEDQMGFTQVDQGLYLPEFETFEGTIRADLTDLDRVGDLFTTAGSCDLRWKSKGLGWIERLSIPLTNLTMANVATSRQVAALAAPANTANGCPGMRRLRLQPHAFHEGDPLDHSGTTWEQQLETARKIWGGCCLEIVAEGLVLHQRSDLRRSNDVSRIRAAVKEKDHLKDLIEVFLVDDKLKADGGAASFSVTTSLARIVMSNDNIGNPTLLAHEIGHILGGMHPGEPQRPGLWVGDPGTVLVPSGSSNLPNPAKNSVNNCRRVRNTALIQTGEDCCISIPA